MGTVGVSPLVSRSSTSPSRRERGHDAAGASAATRSRCTSKIDGIERAAVRQPSAAFSQPVISQSKNEAEIRLREGEVNILGGLSKYQDTHTVSRIPGLVNIPVLGNLLFGGQTHRQESAGTDDRADSAHRAHAGLYGGESARHLRGNRQEVKMIYAPPVSRTGRAAAAGRPRCQPAAPAPPAAPAIPGLRRRASRGPPAQPTRADARWPPRRDSLVNSGGGAPVRLR